MNKVWNPNKNDLKILRLLLDFPEGVRRKSFERYALSTTSTLYKRLNILSEHELIENDSGMWKIRNGQVKFVESLFKGDKKIWELHNPSIVVKLPIKPKWWSPMGSQMKRKLMMLKNFMFQPVKNFGKNNSNPYIQLSNDRYVIQTYPDSVIIIFRKRYHSAENPYDVAIDFTNDFFNLWSWFEEKMKFKFFQDGVPQGFLRGHDYNRINDWFSNKVIEKIGHRIKVDIGDGRHIWYDLSIPYGREADTPELQEIMEKDIKDKVLNKPKLNSELQKDIEELKTETLMQIRDNSKISNDISLAMKQMQSNIRGLTETVYQLIEVIKQDKKKE